MAKKMNSQSEATRNRWMKLACIKKDQIASYKKKQKLKENLNALSKDEEDGDEEIPVDSKLGEGEPELGSEETSSLDGMDATNVDGANEVSINPDDIAAFERIAELYHKIEAAQDSSETGMGSEDDLSLDEPVPSEPLEGEMDELDSPELSEEQPEEDDEDLLKERIASRVANAVTKRLLKEQQQKQQHKKVQEMI